MLVVIYQRGTRESTSRTAKWCETKRCPEAVTARCNSRERSFVLCECFFGMDHTHSNGLFQAFNQELEAMYQDVQLPEDQAWSAMIKDLQTAKKTRNQLSKENL